MKTVSMVVLSVLAVGAFFLFRVDAPPKLKWDYNEARQETSVQLYDAENPSLIRLREEYDLDNVVSRSADEYEALQKIVAWTHTRFKHDGANTPSHPDPLTILKEAAAGERFRCVEYGIVAASALQSLGIPARVLKIRERDTGGPGYGSRHFVVEAWLEQFSKWVYADPQFNVIPEANGIPLNAVEFQAALASKDSSLRITSAPKMTGAAVRNYKNWVAPYLYYFDYDLDQRFLESKRNTGEVMLVPVGAEIPRLLEFEGLRENCTYTSNPAAFYSKSGR